MSSKTKVLTLYRHILRAAKKFPSIKRDHVVQDIRQEFRDARTLTESKVIEQKIATGQRGLEQLVAYSRLSDGQGDWSLHLKGACQ